MMLKVKEQIFMSDCLWSKWYRFVLGFIYASNSGEMGKEVVGEVEEMVVLQIAFLGFSF